VPLLRLSLLMLAVSLSPTAHADEKFRIVPDLAFAPHAPQLRLSLWLTARKGPLPCVPALQGGGFLPQTGKGYRGMAEYPASHRFAAALVACRGRPDQHFPDTLADVRAAAKFLRKMPTHGNCTPPNSQPSVAPSAELWQLCSPPPEMTRIRTAVSRPQFVLPAFSTS